MYTIKILTPTTAELVSITDNSTRTMHYYQDMQPREFEFTTGYQFEIEAQGLAIGALLPGNTYNVTGSWLNSTKKLPVPDFVLGITSAQLITF